MESTVGHGWTTQKPLTFSFPEKNNVKLLYKYNMNMVRELMHLSFVLSDK